jgi:hypothetical protein
VFKQSKRPPGGGTQRLLLYHAGEKFAIAVLPKDTFCFSMRLWHKKA